MSTSDQERLLQALYTSGLQGLEDAAFTMIPKYSIADISGPALDDVGIIVQQIRNGLGDEEYRLHLKGKIAVNSSQGTLDDVYRVWTSFTGTSNIEVVETFPAGVDIATDTAPDTKFIPIIKDYIDRALLAGVSLGQVILYDPANAFTFSSEVIPETSTTEGFGDEGDINTGGKLAGII